MFIQILKKIASSIEWLIEMMGKLIAWLTLLMVTTIVLVLIFRHGFELSAIALAESVTYMHATVFMLGSAYALKHNSHVRVDVFYQKFSARKKAWVEIFGFTFLLLPVCWFIYFYTVNTVALNWALETGSNDPGGIPYLYILMSLMLLLPITLVLQGLASTINNVLFLLGHAPDPNLVAHQSKGDEAHA